MARGKPSRLRARQRYREERRRRRRWQKFADEVLTGFLALQMTGVVREAASLKAMLQSLDPKWQKWCEETLQAGAIECGYADWLEAVLNTPPKEEKKHK